jgi:siderophore synthetase component
LILSDITTIATNLLGSIASQHRLRFINELIHTAAKQTCSLQVRRNAGSSGSALDLPYAWQEAQLGEGHLYHPCYRSRIGFDLTDHQRYGPEFAQGFTLIWLAMDKRLGVVYGLADDEYARFLKQKLVRRICAPYSP